MTIGDTCGENGRKKSWRIYGEDGGKRNAAKVADGGILTVAKMVCVSLNYHHPAHNFDWRVRLEESDEGASPKPSKIRCTSASADAGRSGSSCNNAPKPYDCMYCKPQLFIQINDNRLIID